MIEYLTPLIVFFPNPSPDNNFSQLSTKTTSTMCVVENKTYVYAGSRRREIIRKQYRCHNAPAGSLCAYVEERNTEATRVVERRPNADQTSSSAPRNIVVANGREYRYFPLTSSKRLSGERPSSNNGNQSPADSLVSSSPPRTPIHRTVRPAAPSPPPTPRQFRRVSFREPRALDTPTGTALYPDPPSLNMPRARVNERRPVGHQQSISSLTNEVDNTAPPRRRSSTKRDDRRRDSTLECQSSDITAISDSSHSLSDLPRVYRDRLDSGTNQPYRGDKRQSDDQSRYEEDKRQARLIRDTIAAANERQRAPQYRDAQDSTRTYYRHSLDKLFPEQKDSSGRATEPNLPGAPTFASRQQEVERKWNAEMELVTHEKYAAEQRRQHDPLRITTLAHAYTQRTSSSSSHQPLSPAGSSRLSARTMTNLSSPTSLARTPRYGPAIISQPNPPRNSFAKEGERATNRTQVRGNSASDSLTGMMKRTQLADYDSDDDDVPSVTDLSAQRELPRRYKHEERRRTRGHDER